MPSECHRGNGDGLYLLKLKTCGAFCPMALSKKLSPNVKTLLPKPGNYYWLQYSRYPSEFLHRMFRIRLLYGLFLCGHIPVVPIGYSKVWRCAKLFMAVCTRQTPLSLSRRVFDCLPAPGFCLSQICP